MLRGLVGASTRRIYRIVDLRGMRMLIRKMGRMIMFGSISEFSSSFFLLLRCFQTGHRSSSGVGNGVVDEVEEVGIGI